MAAADDESTSVELVTLPPEQITHGLGRGNTRSFVNIDAALEYSREQMTKDERDVSWIRTQDRIITLADAERQKLTHERAAPA
jgi:hypothetical protein